MQGIAKNAIRASCETIALCAITQYIIDSSILKFIKLGDGADLIRTGESLPSQHSLLGPQPSAIDHSATAPRLSAHEGNLSASLLPRIIPLIEHNC